MIKSLVGNIQNLLIIGLVIVILIMRSCSGGSGTDTPDEPAVVITKVEVRYDTIIKHVPQYVPKIVTRVVRDVDTILITQKIDTLTILKDYFSTYVYRDVIERDSLTLTISDSISQNKILSRNIQYELLYPTVTLTQTEFINRREFYFGIGAAGTRTQLNYVGAQFLYRSKKKQAFGLGVGLDNQFKPILSTQFLWQIGK